MNKLGAHEVMEVHEILSNEISGLNAMMLYRPYVKDQQLQMMMNHQMQACTMDYNQLVQLAQQTGASQAVPARGQKTVAHASGAMATSGGTMPTGGGTMSTSGGTMGTHETMPNYASSSYQPMYGLRQPETQTPAQSTDQLDDADVALALLNCHKQSAALKMKAALEMANPSLRHFVQASANRCADMAYECFQYANQKGYYQVPTLQENTTDTFVHAYGTVSPGNPQPTGGMFM
ncbi:coat protein F [Paenibacillus macerans]|uniref:spore coat protein n=1 Tax=Paenibacillus macerans TaxID=44252 RepID=UPI00207F69B9|nr:spore coat protein [Paenibacillus macerans]GJM70507.1 coat protein F [Paenibacillus macerans]